MEQQLVEENASGQMIDMFIDRQQRGHDGIATLHDQIGYDQSDYCEHKSTPLLTDVHQIARNNQEYWHVKGIYHLLGIGIEMLEIHQVEGNDQNDHHTLQIIQFLYTHILLNEIKLVQSYE